MIIKKFLYLSIKIYKTKKLLFFNMWIITYLGTLESNPWGW